MHAQAVCTRLSLQLAWGRGYVNAGSLAHNCVTTSLLKSQDSPEARSIWVASSGEKGSYHHTRQSSQGTCTCIYICMYCIYMYMYATYIMHVTV